MENINKGDLVNESVLADKLGLSRKDIKKIRDDSLDETDWEKNGRVVQWRASGISKINATLSQDQFIKTTEGNDTSDQKNKPPALFSGEELIKMETLKNDPIKAVITRTFPNPNIVECSLNGEVILVRVKESKNFIRGMSVMIEPSNNGNIWRLARGFRLPRWRGKY